MSDDIQITIKQKKKPRRLIYFSDGVVEEYSTDEEDISKTKDILDVVPIDLSKLSWPNYLWNRTFNFLNVALSKADYCGEKLAWMLGITSPKYQYAIDEYYRQQQLIKEEEEFEERERQADVERKARKKNLKNLTQSNSIPQNNNELDSEIRITDVNVSELPSEFIIQSNNSEQGIMNDLNTLQSESIDDVTMKLENAKIHDLKINLNSSKQAYVNKAYDQKMDSYI